MYERNVAGVLRTRLRELRRFIQALIGPRQTGKTTLARQVMSDSKMIPQYASADEPALKDRVWVEQQWDITRSRLAIASTRKSGLLGLDEIQKVHDWSETVKRLWDEDTNAKLPLHVVILGSSQLLLQQGLSESLAGNLGHVHKNISLAQLWGRPCFCVFL
jgi:predicted AAA+ superfamily ATPase